MSIQKWINQKEIIINFVTIGSPIAIPMNPSDDTNDLNTLYLYNISKETIPEGTEPANVIRDNKGFARSQFALCALKNSTYAIPLHFIKKVAMVFTSYHFCCADSEVKCSDRAIAWIKDLARVFILPLAWPVLIVTALFAAIYPSACLRNALATLESTLLENKEYDILRARPKKDFITAEETSQENMFISNSSSSSQNTTTFAPIQMSTPNTPTPALNISNSTTTTSIPVQISKPSARITYPSASSTSLTVEPIKKLKTVSFASPLNSYFTMSVVARNEIQKTAPKGNPKGILKLTSYSNSLTTVEISSNSSSSMSAKHKLSTRELLIKTAPIMHDLTATLNDHDTLFADPTPHKTARKKSQTAAKKSQIQINTAKRIQMQKDAYELDRKRQEKLRAKFANRQQTSSN
jgi:hypothetical protein